MGLAHGVDPAAQSALLLDDQLLEFANAFAGFAGVGLDEVNRRFELQRSGGQRLQQSVVQLAREAQPLRKRLPYRREGSSVGCRIGRNAGVGRHALANDDRIERRTAHIDRFHSRRRRCPNRRNKSKKRPSIARTVHIVRDNCVLALAAGQVPIRTGPAPPRPQRRVPVVGSGGVRDPKREGSSSLDAAAGRHRCEAKRCRQSPVAPGRLRLLEV